MKTIAIDFDGTITSADWFPAIGRIHTGAKETINQIIKSGNEVIIWSCRDASEIQMFLDVHGVSYTAVNSNTDYLKNNWGNDPRKVGAHLFIDDKNIFCRQINWDEINDELKKQGLITV